MIDRRSLTGCLIGLALGDSLGLPAEGLPPDVIARRWPGPWRHRLLGPWGACSDDTEHAWMIVQSVLAHPEDAAAFQRGLGWRLRGWLASLPPGVGLGTGRACLKLWLGWPAARAGVASAGNGPAMRAPALGVIFADDPDARRAYTARSTALTHRDPQAALAAAAVAEAAAWLSDPAKPAEALWQICADLGPDDDRWRHALSTLAAACEARCAVAEAAARLGLSRGITGYSHHTVPMVLYAVIRHDADPLVGLEALWRCGGDTDTTGAIAGALIGARHGEDLFPEAWRRGLRNGPLSLALLRRGAARLAAGQRGPVPWLWPLVPLRNLLLLAVVLGHGFWRIPWLIRRR